MVLNCVGDMVKKNVNDLKFEPISNIGGKLPAHVRSRRKGMPTIKCVCGLPILVVPDLKAMNRAIERHIAEHVKLSKNAKRGALASDLRQYLIGQILTVTS